MVKIRTVLSWLVACAIFYYLFKKYPFHDILSATKYINFILFGLFVIAHFLLSWLADCWSLAGIWRRFNVNTRAKDFFRIRFVSYLFAIVNGGIGHASLSYLYHREKTLGMGASASVFAYIVFIDMYLAISTLFIGGFFYRIELGGLALDSIIQWLWYSATLSFVALLVASRYYVGDRKVTRGRYKNLFYTVHNARMRDLLYCIPYRLPLHLIVCATVYFVALCYNARLPLLQSIVLSPLVAIFGAIPITPGGLGTRQLIGVDIFKDLVSAGSVDQGLISGGELILSMMLIFTFSNYLLKAISGIIAMRR